MAVRNYYTVGGQLIGESSIATGRFDYMVDSVGTVAGTVDQSAVATGSYRARPYGSQLSTTGTTSSRFKWIGSYGYRASNLKHADIYVRSRTYSSAEGRWNSVDPLIFIAGLYQVPPDKINFNRLTYYEYCSSNPSTKIDPTGLAESACVSLRLPVVPNVTFGLQYCNWCYQCCDMQASASRCWSLEANVNWRLVGLPWDDIGPTLRNLGENLLRLLVGGGIGINQCLHPEQTCVPKSQSGDFEVCLTGCGTLVSASGCVGLKTNSHGGVGFDYGLSLSYGYCGLPSISLKLRVRTKTCG